MDVVLVPQTRIPDQRLTPITGAARANRGGFIERLFRQVAQQRDAVALDVTPQALWPWASLIGRYTKGIALMTSLTQNSSAASSRRISGGALAPTPHVEQGANHFQKGWIRRAT